MLLKIPSLFDIFTSFVLILGIFAILAYASGWFELAELYKTDLKLADSEIAARVKNCRCRIGRTIDKCVTRPRSIAFLEAGVYLNAGTDSIPVFNIIQPPLLIPWREIKPELIDSQYHFYFGNPTISILILGLRGVRELEQLSGISISDRLNNN